MLKGLNRNVIVVKADKSSSFETVYFVMKRNGRGSRTDILKEANDIVSDSGMLERRENTSRHGLKFFLGVLIGFLISSALWLIILLAL